MSLATDVLKTTTIMTSSTTFKPGVKDVASFLSEYSVMLFGSGATCIRMEKNLHRIARSQGMEAEFSILPRHIHLTVGDGSDTVTSVVAIRDMPISFAKIALLSKLSWQMADCRCDFRQAVKVLAKIGSTLGTPPWRLLLLVSLANASFCRLFGGDAMAMSVVFVATFAGFLVKQVLTDRHVDFRLTAVACSFISAVIASSDALFSLGTTPEIAVGTSVLYLVPGIPFINSFCDMIDRHYLCSFGRMVNAVVISCCLSLGLCAGMLLMNLGMF